MNFIVVSGPTGVGKTHLLVRLVANIWNARAEVKREPSCIPVISTVAIAHGALKFDFKRLYRDALIALGDIFVERRLPGTLPPDPTKTDHNTSVAVLRWTLEQEFKKRGTEIWIIDEAQHVLLGGAKGSANVEDQFDVLKSIAQTTGVKIVLCGTHRLRELVRLTGQVMRRSAPIVLDRYHNNVEEELTEFCSVVQALFKKLPVTSYPDVIVHQAFFYSGTLGCVGVLKDWIARAWASAVIDGRDDLQLKDFEETRIDEEALEQMPAEISWCDAGSGKLEWRTKKMAGTQRGGKAKEEPKEKASAPTICASKKAAKRTTRGGKAHTPRPGRRNSTRDAVGPMAPANGPQTANEEPANEEEAANG